MRKVLEAIIFTTSFLFLVLFERLCSGFFMLLLLAVEYLKAVDTLPLLLLVSGSLAWFGAVGAEGADRESLVGLVDSEISIYLRPKRKILLFPEIPVTRKNFTRAAANLFFFTNLIEFLK